MRDVFSTFHPVINLLFFLLVLTFSMFFTHPACLLISMTSALIYSIHLKGRQALAFAGIFLLPMVLFTALINPLLNHRGGTILAYLPNGNPITLESVVFGVAAAVMLVAVICWFSCFNVIMTSDKLVFLFGRVIPALSLLLSMTLRFVPRFRAQLKVIAEAQKGIGRDATVGSWLRRLGQGMRIISIMVTWALENAIDTADSMKGRGYGLPGRTAFSLYTFGRRDGIALVFLLITSLYIITGALSGGLYFRYFPTIKGDGFSIYTLSLGLAYTALCLMPVILDLREACRWKAMRSKI